MNQHKRKFSIATVIVLWAWTACGSAEFNYASYIETTLQDIITEERNHSVYPAAQKKTLERVEIECQTAKYRVSCNYTAVRRPISGNRKNVIKLWVQTLQIEPTLASLYRQEIKVTEGMNVHWIPVQEKLLPHINRNLGRNDAIESDSERIPRGLPRGKRANIRCLFSTDRRFPAACGGELQLFILFLGKDDLGYIFIATEFNEIDSNQRKPDLTNAVTRLAQ